MNTPTHPRDRSKPFVCQRCSGPCRQYAGDTHGWTCRACLITTIGLPSEPPDADPLPLGPLISRRNSNRKDTP